MFFKYWFFCVFVQSNKKSNTCRKQYNCEYLRMIVYLSKVAIKKVIYTCKYTKKK